MYTYFINDPNRLQRPHFRRRTMAERSNADSWYFINPGLPGLRRSYVQLHLRFAEPNNNVPDYIQYYSSNVNSDIPSDPPAEERPR